MSSVSQIYLVTSLIIQIHSLSDWASHTYCIWYSVLPECKARIHTGVYNF